MPYNMAITFEFEFVNGVIGLTTNCE